MSSDDLAKAFEAAWSKEALEVISEIRSLTSRLEDAELSFESIQRELRAQSRLRRRIRVMWFWIVLLTLVAAVSATMLVFGVDTVTMWVR